MPRKPFLRIVGGTDAVLAVNRRQLPEPMAPSPRMIKLVNEMLAWLDGQPLFAPRA
jgi:hypothetical protein